MACSPTTCARDLRAVVGGIEREEFVHRHLGEARGRAHVHVDPGRHAGEIGLVRQVAQVDAVLRGIGDDVADRHQPRHVVARLLGQNEAREIAASPARAAQRHGARHRLLAPVVGRERELPVPLQLVERLQVVERGVGGRDHVAARVVLRRLRELVARAGARDELPQARCVRARVGHRIERALDDGQQRDLGGHAALLQLLDDVEQVPAVSYTHLTLPTTPYV